MKIIVDTHALLWFFSNDINLSEKARETIVNSNNDVFISIASFWEISIKLSLSKLALDIPFELLFDESERLNMSILNVKKEHLVCLKELPFIHKDPFDRMIACQSIVENYTLVSIDKIFDDYNIERFW